MVHNQEGVIDENELSPDFQRYRKRLSKEDEDQEGLSASSDGVQVNLTRSNASVGQSLRSDTDYLGNKLQRAPPTANINRPPAAKQPYQGYNRYLFDQDAMDEGSDDDEDKDLAWFFKTHHPDIDKHRQIAWCRTFANCLAAQMPKLRPKTYKKKAKTEPEENIYKIKGI